ncbi:MAG: response regulator [Chloroflexota bacterium]
MTINNLQDSSDWRVLIVDDEPDNVLILESVLSLKGITCVSALSAKDAEALLEDFEPNLILLDLSMPEVDGFTFLKILRERSDTASVPVIAVTAHVVRNKREEVLEAGFNGYIVKPFDVFSLVATVQGILGFQTS